MAAAAETEYPQRLEQFRLQDAGLERRLDWVGNTRFLLLVAGLVVLILAAVAKVISLLWLLVPAVLFVGFSWYFERLYRRQRYARAAIAYYDHGLARLEDRWAGRGISGAGYLDENHLYAADLDLFGRGSLFERLCDARTRSGRDTLARWLCAPAPPDEVRARQEAVHDLRDRVAWLEHLALLGSAVPDGIDTAVLAAWGEAAGGRRSPWPRLVAPGLAALSLALVAAWLLGWVGLGAVVLALLVEGGLALWLKRRVRRALHGLHGRSRDLLHLAGILTAIERETFAAARLRDLQASLCSEGVPPSQRLGQLVRLVEMLDYTRNFYFAVVAPLLLWTTQVALAVERWRQQAGPVLGRWLVVIGEIEALNALAGYAYENPDDPFPEVVPGGPLFDGTGLGHPLLPRRGCVTNDLRLDAERRLLIVSGSNMSGKSTFLRTAGINAVLALAGAPVRATRLRLSLLAVGATLRIQDSLQAGRSRFYAEITRLRQIVELTRGPLPVLFLLDEILHGTNSHDRRIGAEAVVRSLLRRPAVGLVTTHDLALTQLAAELSPQAVNVHFADEMKDGVLHFDYRLQPGVVQHSNALALMRAVGLDVTVPEAKASGGG
jgi:hypothetical protein